ncbi:MAG: acyl carrier protein [Lachnospiraceae bacterium]|nr:acyl carrier protein [Lachnospiraceae bacterium]
MTNLEKYNNAFVESLELSIDEVNENLTYQGITNWDSVGHMALIAVLEDTFDIMLDTEDIIDFSSYEKGKEILAKYDIAF